MLDRLGTPGGVRTLLVLASNIVVSAPHTANVLSRLRALDFLAVSDIFLSETAAEANVVLPTAQWAEICPPTAMRKCPVVASLVTDCDARRCRWLLIRRSGRCRQSVRQQDPVRSTEGSLRQVVPVRR
jgi:hypothetical protein